MCIVLENHFHFVAWRQLTLTYALVLIVSVWQVDMLSEINIAPRILTNFTGVMPPQFKKDLDSYLKTRSPVTFLSDLRSNLQVNWFGLILSYMSFIKSTFCAVLICGLVRS